MKRKLQCLLITLSLLAIATPVYAETPKIVTGTVSLLNDAFTWIVLLIPGATAARIAYLAFEKQMSGNDPAVSSSANKGMTTALKWGAIGTTASGLVKAILAYYA